MNQPANTRDDSLLDLVQVVVIALDCRGRVSLINRKGAELLGYPVAEILGRDWFENFLPEATREPTSAVFRELMAGRVREAEYFENPVLTRDGEQRMMAWRNTVLQDADGTPSGTLSSGEDITERTVARRELQDTKYALDQAAIVAITDQRGIIHHANDKFCEISGYSREELLGQDHRLLNSGYHPKAFIRDLWRTIAGGSIWRGEIRNRAKDGGFYWVDTTIVPLLNEHGRPYQYLAIRSDITQRKLAEEQLRERDALARLGQMSAVVAHEVKNPLAGIGGAIQIIGSRLPQDSPDRDVIASILERINALNRKIEDLLAYSRPKPPRFVQVPLHELLEEMTDLLGSDPAFAGVEVSVQSERTVVEADPDLLREVFVNLLLNAAQAMNGEGRIEIAEHIDGDWCRVVMADTGPGVAREVRERIFEPFFSTRHSGTGLGLSIAKRVIEDHGGTISIDDREHGGTEVSVGLPLKRPELVLD